MDYVVDQFGNGRVLGPEKIGEFSLWPAVRPQTHVEIHDSARTLAFARGRITLSGLSRCSQGFHGREMPQRRIFPSPNLFCRQPGRSPNSFGNQLIVTSLFSPGWLPWCLE